MENTQVEITENDKLFLNMMENFVDYQYEIDEDYQVTEDDQYIFSIIYEHFLENFKEPGSDDIILEDITGYDVNEKLWEEIHQVLLDESIGKYVAGAIHGMKHVALQGGKAYAKFALDRARAKERAKTGKSRNYNKQVKNIAKAGTEKISSPMKDAQAAYRAQKQNVLAQKADKAVTKRKAMGVASQRASGKLTYHKQKTSDLATKIDKGISDLKQRTKQRINTGVQRVAGILGRAAGHIGL